MCSSDLNVSCEVLEMPQKTGFLGLKLTPAKVCVSVEEPDAPAAPAVEEKKAPVQEKAAPAPVVEAPAAPAEPEAKAEEAAAPAVEAAAVQQPAAAQPVFVSAPNAWRPSPAAWPVRWHSRCKIAHRLEFPARSEEHTSELQSR